MSREVKVSPQRSGRTMSFDGSGDKLKITWEIVFHVLVVDPDPLLPSYYDAGASEFEIMTAPGLPITNASVYVFDGKIIPYVICRKKTAKQSSKNAALWEVSCSYDSGDVENNKESDNQPQDPPVDVTDITPREEVTIEFEERVLYKDKADKNVLTPTGNFYAEPLVEQLPILVIKLTQYEASITYQQMLDRSKKANEATYRTKPRYSWMIDSVEAVDVKVLTTGGEVTAALVTYTLKYNPRTNGWKEDRLLVDTHFYAVDGGGVIILDGTQPRKVAFTDIQSFGNTTGFIDATGKYKSGSTPDSETYETMDTLTFSGFLQA